MTNFILDDGVVVDHGQEWEIDLLTGTFIMVIDALSPRTEQIIFTVENLTRDIVWSSFSMSYNNGMIRRYNTGLPSKRLPPHIFT